MARNLGPYELIERVAVGGIAEIFLARERSTPDAPPCALKVLLPQYAESDEHRQALVDEAHLTAQLAHPNIVEVHGVGAEGDTLYMAMEHIEGHDLAGLIEMAAVAREPMRFEAAAFIIEQVCAALHFAHTRVGADGHPLHLVHRDVSPRNVLVSVRGDVKLLDFGVAKADGAGRMETKTGIIKGKLAYMAPEYAVGQLQDARSDVFSTAVCLFELVTGRPAYDRFDPAVLIESVKTAAIPSPRLCRPDTPVELEEIIALGLRAHPNERYATAAAMQQALAAFLQRTAPGFGREDLAASVRSLSEAAARVPQVAPALAGFADLARESRDAIIEDPEQVAILETVAMTDPASPHAAIFQTLDIEMTPVDAEHRGTATDVDVRPLRVATASAEILTASGFQRHVTGAELEAIRAAQTPAPTPPAAAAAAAAAPGFVPAYAMAPAHAMTDRGNTDSISPPPAAPPEPEQRASPPISGVVAMMVVATALVALMLWAFLQSG